MNTLEKEIFSRVLGLMVSPAAAVDLILNAVTLLVPGHVQKIRDAVFPLLFGSLLGCIHPYLGTYFVDPVKKHIAMGILAEGTSGILIEDKIHAFEVVISPLTAIEEILSLGVKASMIDAKGQQMIRKMASYEREFEKIQSFDFFNLDLTGKVGNVLIEYTEPLKHFEVKLLKRIVLSKPFKPLKKPLKKCIELLRNSPVIHAIAKRVTLLAYPVLTGLDLTVMLLSSALCLSVALTKVLGGQAPAYLETASSPHLLIYSIVKPPLFLIAATFQGLYGLIDPQKAFSISTDFNQAFIRNRFNSQMKAISQDLQKMKQGEQILIPSVVRNAEEENNKQSFVPARSSHMRYIIVEKVDDDHYQAELIDRNHRSHKKTKRLSHKDMHQTLSDILAMRYKFASSDAECFSKLGYHTTFTEGKDLIDLGEQSSILNCVITNLLAAIRVMKAENEDDFKQSWCKLKGQAAQRYKHYLTDSYPFGYKDQIVGEIQRNLH